VFDVGEHEFLVLLFVMQAKLEHREQFGKLRRIETVEERQQMLVHVSPIPVDLLHRRPGEQTALRAAMPFTGSDVV
jgi:hypothetical protein